MNNKSGSCTYDNYGSIQYSIIFHIMYNIIISLKS
jgi:hypothetical protein